MTDVIFEEVNPNGNIQAIVESDEDVTFFYLFGAPDTGQQVKSVWVCNHAKAPEALDVERMKKGLPPRNPAKHCLHPEGRQPPQAENLSVVWLPEGNGAALYESGNILAIIPPWSGIKGFDGYSSECCGEGPVSWALSDDNVLIKRFKDASAYWQKWDDGNLWSSVQSSLMTQVEAKVGPHSNYYAIDGGNWPPKAMVRIPLHNSILLVTIGVSVRPQPNVETQTETPELLRRIELGVVLPSTWPEESVRKFGQYLSGQSNLPWTQYTWLGPGHTLPCDSWLNREFPYAACVHNHPMTSWSDLGTQFGDPVNVLWLIPISANERDLAIAEGFESLASSIPFDRWKHA